MMSPSLKHGLYAASLLLSVGLTSCAPDQNDPGVEYAPEMYESIPYEPLRQLSYNSINAFGINERVPAVGSVPRGKLAYFDHIPKDSVRIAERVLHNPYVYSKANVEEGQVLYSRYCMHCHGEKGDGQGPVGMKFKGVPNYANGAYKTMNDGHIFHVIEWGRNRMMPHGSQVNPEERWKIAMYVHVLQIGNDPADLSKVVKVGVPNSADSTSRASNSATTDDAYQQKSEGVSADAGTNKPGQGTKARNGTSN